jgi:hypothetical protein
MNTSSFLIIYLYSLKMDKQIVNRAVHFIRELVKSPRTGWFKNIGSLFEEGKNCPLYYLEILFGVWIDDVHRGGRRLGSDIVRLHALRQAAKEILHEVDNTDLEPIFRIQRKTIVTDRPND